MLVGRIVLNIESLHNSILFSVHSTNSQLYLKGGLGVYW